MRFAIDSTGCDHFAPAAETPDVRLRMQPTIARGSCLCGSVRFRANLPSKWIAHCHCTRCQRAHGAPFVTWAGFHAHDVAIEAENQALRWYESDAGGSRGSCGVCGSPMFFRYETRYPGELHVARALFADPLDKDPQVHAFYETHAPWVSLADDLPKKTSQVG